MKRCFICSTLYQIFNAVNIVFNETDKSIQSDLFLFDASQISNQMEMSLKKIFDHIYFVKTRTHSKNRIKRYINRTLDLLFPKLFLSKTVYIRDSSEKRCIDYIYDEIYFSYLMHFSEAMVKVNPKATVCRIEDGIGTYFGDINKRSFGKLYMLFSKVFNVGYEIAMPKKILINNPKLFDGVDECEILQLPSINNDFLNMANMIFDSKKYSFRKIIWLTQPISYFCDEKAIINSICTNIKGFKDYISVKIHPSDTNVSLYEDFFCVQQSGLWELNILNINIDEYILFGIYSSAQFTPKILFDKEPYVILLYKLFPNLFPDQANLVGFVNKFISSYKDKSRIVVPESFDEMIISINQIINKKTDIEGVTFNE